MSEVIEGEVINKSRPELDAYKARVQELELNLEAANEAFTREVNAHRQTAVQLKYLQRQG